MSFDLHIGIDYSGRATPTTRTAALQVYAARHGGPPRAVRSPASNGSRRRNWQRREIFDWLLRESRRGARFIAGVDHGFSFPVAYFQRHCFSSWLQFLEDFVRHFPTDGDDVEVNALRAANASRIGRNNEFRLTELWTSSAKSVFQFDVQGSVAKSTYAGLPWLRRLRVEAGDRIHVWPFDGWTPEPGKCVVAEIFPSIFRNRYDRRGRTVDQQDAYATARWLAETDRRGLLPRYFEPPLTESERAIADLEGWILGVA